MTPSASDIALITKNYAADFEAERDAELERMARPLNKLRAKIGSKLGL